MLTETRKNEIGLFHHRSPIKHWLKMKHHRNFTPCTFVQREKSLRKK
jgi:hypothetical protein